MFRSSLSFKIILLAATVALSGCWKPSKKDDPHNGKSERDATASFFVRSIKCEAVTPKSNNTVWKVADHKEIFARACLTDRKASKEIKGHLFTIENLETGTRQTGLTSDDEGCFQWQEEMPYNPYAEKSGYIEVRRRIYGEGVHVGFRDIRLEINPWAGERGIDKQEACKFAKSGQISTSQKLDPANTKLALAGKTGRSRLWMEEVIPMITLTNERDEALRQERNLYDGRKETPGQPKRKAFADESGALLEVLLSMKPRMRVEGLDGNPEFIPLKSGQYNIWVQLIAANVGDNRDQTLLLTPNLIPADGKIVGEKLVAAVRMGLSRRVTRGRLELAIKVVPVGLKLDVEPFETLYVLGDIENILGGFRPALSPKTYESDQKFNYDEYVTSADNFEELKKAQQALKHEPFIFETSTMMFAGIRPGETATKRTIEYKIQTCVRDTLTGKLVQHQKFRIFDEETNQEIFNKQPNGSLDVPTTNQQGCLIWVSSLTHKYYQPEEFFFPKFKIVHPGSGVTKIKELVINPWDAMFRTFGFDRIEFTQEFIDSVKNRKKIPSRMFIPRYSYHAIRFRYEIDRFMELEVKKQILLNLRPDVLRYSGIIGGRKVTESLRDGIYLMKVAIQKDYLDPTDKGYFLMPGRDSRGKETTVQKRSGRNKAVPKHFVTVVKKLVRVNSGEINTPVEFAVQDLRMMRIRTQFLVQLEPVDEQLLLVAKVLAEQDKKKIADLDKARAMSDDMRRHLITERRERLEANLVKIRGQLANLKTGMIDPEKFADLSEAELQAFDLTKELSQQVVEDLKLNDFTVLSTAPLVDLDKLVEKDSGLDKRTFVGPMIFLSNAYSDDLRPTDNLDERTCDVSDCDQIKTREIEGRKFRNNYDTSKFFGSVAHLAGKQVDDLIADYYLERADYKRMMPAVASVSNFADIYNLKVISLSKERFLKADWTCSDSVEKCTKPADNQYDIDKLMALMNAKDGEFGKISNMREVIMEPTIPRMYWPKLDVSRPVTLDDFKVVARGGVVPRALGDRLCQLYALNLGNAVMVGFKERTQRDVYNHCLNAVIHTKDDGRNSPFTLDTKLRVFETGEYVYRGGKQMNLNVGSSFSLNHNYSFGVSYGAGIDLVDFPFIGALGPWAKPFSLKLGAGGGANRSKSDGTSISESTYLVMQAASFAIQLKDYERCTVVKMNNRVIGPMLRYYTDPKDKDAERNLYVQAQRGLFICSGERETKPLPVTESYFYFTQHFTEGDMLDQADLYNHPWLLAMRGVRDFSTFAYLIRAQEFSLYSPFTPVVDKPGWPLDQMVEAYRQVLPTFPGLYTVLRKGEALQEFPFDQDAEDSFK